MDIPLGIIRLEKQQLRDDDVRYVVVDWRAEENDAIHEQTREDVVAPLAAARPLDHIRGIQRWHCLKTSFDRVSFHQPLENFLFRQAVLDFFQAPSLL